MRLVSPDEGDNSKVNNGGVDNNTTKILIGVFVSVAVVVLITVLVIIYIKRKGANKVADQIVPQFS